jgi:hypothetical protein
MLLRLFISAFLKIRTGNEYSKSITINSRIRSDCVKAIFQYRKSDLLILGRSVEISNRLVTANFT